METPFFTCFDKKNPHKFFNVSGVDKFAPMWKVKIRRKSGEKCEWKEEKRCKIL